MPDDTDEATYCTGRMVRSVALAQASSDPCARASHTGLATAYGERLTSLSRNGDPAMAPAAPEPLRRP